MAQRDNVLLANQARMQGCSWFSGPFAPAAPPSNLLLREPSDLLILTDVNDAWVRFTIPAARAFRMAWLGYANVSDAAQWQVVYRNGGSPVHDSGLLDCVPAGEGAALRHRKYRRHCLYLIDAAVMADEVEITIIDPGNPDGRIMVGSLIADDPFQPAHNLSYGVTVPSLTDPSRVPVAGPGQRAPLNRSPYDVAGFELRWGSEAEMIGAYRDFVEYTGTTIPCLAVLQPQATAYRERWMIYGLLEALQPVQVPFFELYSTAFRIEELIP